MTYMEHLRCMVCCNCHVLHLTLPRSKEALAFLRDKLSQGEAAVHVNGNFPEWHHRPFGNCGVKCFARPCAPPNSTWCVIHNENIPGWVCHQAKVRHICYCNWWLMATVNDNKITLYIRVARVKVWHRDR